jgi:hypothetical protein
MIIAMSDSNLFYMHQTAKRLLRIVCAYALVVLQLELLEVARPHHLRIHCPLTTIQSFHATTASSPHVLLSVRFT